MLSPLLFLVRPAPASLFVLPLCFVFPVCARAQFVKVQAGASDLLPSEGGAISFQGANYTGSLNAGDLSGSFGFGAFLKTTTHSRVFTFGDQPIDFDLPTDVFSSSHLYPARGLGIASRRGPANIFLFLGGTTSVGGTSFFQSAKAESAAAMLFADTPVSRTLHFYSKTVFSRRRTSMQSIDWTPNKWFRGGLAAGLGSNQPYFASTATVENARLSLKTSYVAAGDRFRRILASSVFASEVSRENIVAVVKPYSSLVLTLGHQNILQPASLDPVAPFLRASVNQAQAAIDVHDFRVGLGAFQSSFQGGSNQAADFSVSRRITRRLDVSFADFRSSPTGAPAVNNLSASFRETISPRISLLQVVNYSQGHTSVLYGGSYLSNLVTIDVDYQTLYLPFRSNAPLTQGISIAARFRLFGVQLNAQTFRSADGQLRYTASGDRPLVSNFHRGPSETERAFKTLRYMVRGRVVDQNGLPVEGAALLIGNEQVLTNSAGEFWIRLKNDTVLRVQVLFAEFQNPAPFRIVSCPETITPAPEDRAPELLITLARN